MNTNTSYPGILVVVEGINGSGKTTIINELKNHLDFSNMKSSYYKFPDRTGVLGEKIDGYLKGSISITSKYDIIDMFAQNRKAVKCDIVKDLYDGKIVICDRYVFSAIAYQIPGHITDAKKIHRYCNVIGYFDKEMPLPDLIYLVDGDHLNKRRGIVREIFHDTTGNGAKNKKQMLYSVINNFTNRFLILKNREGSLPDVVKTIYYDILHRQKFA